MIDLAQTPRPFGGTFPSPEAITAPGASTPDVATIKGLEAIFHNIVVMALSVAGLALFIMLVIGGFKYLTAGGNQEQAQAAQQTLTVAFIGFVVIVGSYLILKLIGEFTGIDLTSFTITQ